MLLARRGIQCVRGTTVKRMNLMKYGKTRNGLSVRHASSLTWDRFRSSVQKVYNDMDQFNKWDAENLFAPDLSYYEKVSYFSILHYVFPAKHGFDLPEFLGGAQVALDLVFHTIYSKEFLQVATGDALSTPQSELVKDCMENRCADLFFEVMRETHERGLRYELKQLDIHACQLEAIKPFLDKDTIQLQVLYKTTEHLAISTAEKEEKLIERDSNAVWTFESSIKDPEVLDWKIVSISD